MPSRKVMIGNSQTLRKNMTKEEKHLWYDFLNKLPFTVNRQKVFDNYIVDFFIAERRTVIEIDGEQHLKAENREKDKIRDAYFVANQIQVLRYSNREITRHFNDICKHICDNIGYEWTEYLANLRKQSRKQ